MKILRSDQKSLRPDGNCRIRAIPVVRRTVNRFRREAADAGSWKAALSRYEGVDAIRDLCERARSIVQTAANRAAAIAIVLLLFGLVSQTEATLTAHFKLDDYDEQSMTVDAAVGSDGSLAGGHYTSDVQTDTGPGNLVTKSFQFDGMADYVYIPTSGIQTDAAFSLSAFVKFDTATGAFAGRSGQNWTYVYKSSDTTILVNLLGQSATFTVPSLGVTDWHHILVSREATTNLVRVFVDGQESSSGPQEITNTSGPTAFSHLGIRNSTLFEGKIAWVKFFSDDESANMTSLFAEGSNLPARRQYYYQQQSSADKRSLHLLLGEANFALSP
jgi:hypothetical protein